MTPPVLEVYTTTSGLSKRKTLRREAWLPSDGLACLRCRIGGAFGPRRPTRQVDWQVD